MIDPEDIERVQRSHHARQAQALGAGAEQMIAHRLRAMGFLCVQRIEVGWRIHRIRGRITGAAPMSRVMGDFTAITPGGRAVVVEMKVRRGRNLPFSAVEPHQRAALNAVRDAGGLSLLAWASEHGVVVMRWDTLNILPRESLTWAEAQIHAFQGP